MTFDVFIKTQGPATDTDFLDDTHLPSLKYELQWKEEINERNPLAIS